MAGARAGAEWAWTAIYHDLAPGILGYLRMQRAPDPEDLLGEVFLQLVRDLPRFSGGERDFRAWAFTIAHHRLLDDRRHRGRRPVEPARADVIDSSGPVGDAEQEAFRGLAAERVRRLIAQLSSDQQRVLLLRILGDLTVEEVARVIGKRPGAVKALQRRGLAGIRKALEREGVTL
jgi:RNA polymerase sigma factor (sigma-70 family)